jgi:DnaJ-class molecular chaperone
MFTFDNITQQNQVHRYRNFFGEVDLVVKTHIKNTEDFQLKDKKVYSKINLNIFKAILGGKMEIKTIHGNEIIDLPPNQITNFNQVIEGKGFKGGDHIAKFNIFLPKELTDKQRELLNYIINEEKIKNKA